MSEARDLLVIGGGPAGVEAALEAERHGLTVTLVDEAPAAGGQVYRAPPRAFAVADAGPEARAGDELRARLSASRVETLFDHSVWSVSPGFRVDALGPDGPRSWQARAVLVATGAQERVISFPGWTLPGVIGLAGATILLKSQRMLPGRRTLVAGCGPLLLAVAAGILKAGGEVAAVVDAASPREWLARLPAMASRPDLLLRGTGWLAQLKRAGVPMLSGQMIRRVEASNAGLTATVGGIGGGAEVRFSVDAVAVGHGLTPSTDVTRLLRADHVYDAARGGWCPVLDDGFRTTVPGLYAVGDGAGIRGVAAATLDGRLAGLAVARDLDRASGNGHASLRRRAVGARRFGGAMAELMALRPALVDAITPETIVCRCEDVTRAEIDEAAGQGATTLNQLKAWTRCGMGPCQGRICGDVAGALLARSRASTREAVGQFTGRAPFRPLPLDQLVGTYDYGDIVLPPPAPL